MQRDGDQDPVPDDAAFARAIAARGGTGARRSRRWDGRRVAFFLGGALVGLLLGLSLLHLLAPEPELVPEALPSPTSRPTRTPAPSVPAPEVPRRAVPPPQCSAFLETRATELTSVLGAYPFPDDGQLSIAGLHVSPDARRLFATSWTSTLRIWELESALELRRFESSEKKVFGRVGWLPDGRHAVAAAAGQGLVVYDFEGSPDDARKLGGGPARLAVPNPEGTRALVVDDRSIRLEYLATGASIGSPFDAPETVQDLAWLPDGKSFVSAGGLVTRWEVASGNPTPIVGPIFMSCLAVAADGRTALTGGGEGASLIDLERARVLGFCAHRNELAAVALSPDGALGVTACRDGFVRLFDTRSMARPIDEIDLDSSSHDSPTALLFEPDGKHLLVGTTRGVVLRFAIRR